VPSRDAENRAKTSRDEPSRERVARRVASPRMASPPLLPGNNYEHFNDARIGKGHVTVSAVTSRVSSDATIKALSHMSDPEL
jgi:hypothetical protein